MAVSFLDKFKRKIDKVDDIIKAPVVSRWGLSSGNYALNRILSGTYGFGSISGPFMQGKMNMLAGLSGVGKSFILSTAAKSALDNDFLVLMLDTENALDKSYLEKIGIDSNHGNFVYYGITTVNDVVKIISTFVKEYKEAYKDDLENGPKVLIIIDSLSYLTTDSELDNFMSGEIKGDQGQIAKQTGSMLKGIQHAIKALNITLINTSHVYENSQIINGKGKFLLGDKIKYPQTFIALLEKRPLKEGTAVKAETTGFIMLAKTFKSRLNVLNAHAEIEVPWNDGMSPFSGIADVLKTDGLIKEHNTQKYVVVSTGEIVQKGEFETWLTHERLKEICYDYDNKVEEQDNNLVDENIDEVSDNVVEESFPDESSSVPNLGSPD